MMNRIKSQELFLYGVKLISSFFLTNERIPKKNKVHLFTNKIFIFLLNENLKQHKYNFYELYTNKD